jgi:hypothetical protein
MLHCMALVTTDVSEERIYCIIRVTIIAELGKISSLFLLLVTANVIPRSPILVTLLKEAIRSSETSVPTRTTRRNISQDSILLSE